MKWYQIKIKVSDNNLNKNVQWYDLLKCNYYNNMGQISFIYLPAAFLMCWSTRLFAGRI
jgi:hypothetical protein